MVLKSCLRLVKLKKLWRVCRQYANLCDESGTEFLEGVGSFHLFD